MKQGDLMTTRAVNVIFMLIFAKMSFSFTHSTICVDVHGNRIISLESALGFVFDQNYKYKQPSISLSSSYSSTYNSVDFIATEEVVENYNRIGEKVGTHWLACKGKRNISYELIIGNDIIQKVNTYWTGSKPSIAVEKLLSGTEIKIPIGKSITFKKCLRDAICDVNVYDPSTGVEGIEQLGKLSDNIPLKRIINVFANGKSYTNECCLASAYIILGNGDHNPWNKPLIVADGFDPRSRIGIQEVLENVPNSLAPSAYKFISSVTKQGYDVIFVDFNDGGNDIIENAKVLLKVIETVCSHTNSNVVVSGYSMGGLLARVALLIGEKNNIQCMNKIDRFISIDAPHSGGQVNLDMQRKLLSIVNNPLDKPSNYLAYELIASSAYDLQSVAARQMLFSHAISSEHDNFFEFIKHIGNYPSGIKMYAIGDAAWKWPYPQANINGQFAATFNGTNLYLKGEDLFPGSYIDLWAAESNDLSGFIPSFIPSLGAKYIKEYLGISTVIPPNSTFGDLRYRPTHIPLFSAFGIDKSQFLLINEPGSQTDLDNIARAYSPFDKIFIVNSDNRPRHIEFDDSMVDKVLKSLKRTPDISSIITFLLSN